MIFLLIILITISLFGLASVVDFFLIPAVYRLRDRYSWTDDQTGTIISFVSSAPELSVSGVALILGAVSGNLSQASVGPGTVIGSALFSILFIVGASAWFNTKKLSWPAVIRDMLYYLFSVFLIYLIVKDSNVTLFESGIALTFFVIYSMIVSRWKLFLNLLKNYFPKLVEEEEESLHGFEMEVFKKEEEDLHIADQNWTLSNFHSKILSFFFFRLDKKNGFWIYFWNIFLSIILVIGFSTLMVNSAVYLSELLGVSPVIISLTVLAAGTSVPDLLASIKTSKEGYGDTAIANAVGSNIFDLLANLGLTWLIGSLLTGGKNVFVETANLEASIILLFAATGSLILILIAKKWHLGKIVSLVLMGSYIFYIIFEVWKVIEF